MSSKETKQIRHFKLLKKVGAGNFGIAYKALDTKSNKTVCVKIIKDQGSDELTKKYYQPELVLGELSHPNVVQIFEGGNSVLIKDKANEVTRKDSYYTVTEWAENGTLDRFVAKARGFNELNARLIFKQIIAAVEYIHSKGIVHRDLKLQNILLDSKLTVKIADFGLAKDFVNNCLTTQCGSGWYMAPELLTEEKNEYFGPSVDVFSLGTILYIMLTNSIPFRQAGDKYYQNLISDPVAHIKKYAEGRKLSRLAVHLIVNMLYEDPNMRFSLEDVKEHPFLSGPSARQRDVYNLFQDVHMPKQFLSLAERKQKLEAEGKKKASVQRFRSPKAV